MVTAGTPSAIGTFESVDDRASSPDTPKTAVVANARWISGSDDSREPEGLSPTFLFSSVRGGAAAT